MTTVTRGQKRKRNMLKLITLDLDNTLWDVTPTIIAAEKTLVGWMQQEIPSVLPHYQKDALMHLRKQFVQEFPDKAHFPTDMRKYILRHCFQQAGIAPSDLDPTVEAAFSVFIHARNQVTLFPETLDILSHLSTHFDVIALSNGNADLSMIGIDHFFKAHFSAESVGKAKPDPTMFHNALATSQCAAHESLHVGDHPIEDIETARALGFNTVWFNENNQQASHLCQPTQTIHHLDSLIPLIDNIHRSSEE